MFHELHKGHDFIQPCGFLWRFADFHYFNNGIDFIGREMNAIFFSLGGGGHEEGQHIGLALVHALIRQSLEHLQFFFVQACQAGIVHPLPVLLALLIFLVLIFLHINHLPFYIEQLRIGILEKFRHLQHGCDLNDLVNVFLGGFPAEGADFTQDIQRIHGNLGA